MGPVEDFVRELQAGEGGDIGVHGSISLTQSLLAAGLVDEVRLLVAPRVVGSGRRLFEDDTALSRAGPVHWPPVRLAACPLQAHRRLNSYREVSGLSALTISRELDCSESCTAQ